MPPRWLRRAAPDKPDPQCLPWWWWPTTYTSVTLTDAVVVDIALGHGASLPVALGAPAVLSVGALRVMHWMARRQSPPRPLG